jgi:hypothetical protein
MIKRLVIAVIMGAVLTGFTFGTAAVHVRFDSINGLVAKDRVVFDGAAIGKVKKIKYGDDGIFWVSLSIEKDFRDFLTEYSRFTITEDPRDSSRKAVEMILTHMGGAPLKNGSSVDGSSKYQVLLEMMKDDAKDGVKYLKKEYQRFSNELKSLSENEKVRELMDQMVRLEEELKEASRETRDKITSEIIPMLEKEIEALRKELEALGREEEVEPLEKELDKIKYI